MKVLLMVEREGRVVCIQSRCGWTYNGDWLNTSPPLSLEVLEETEFSRWWLVEAESAEDARHIISDAPKGGGDPSRYQCAIGSILASGGRS